MNFSTLTDVAYLIAAVCFIFALIGLSSPHFARNGNIIGAVGMGLAIGFTFGQTGMGNMDLIIPAMVLGLVIGVVAARMVKMTAMPQMVAAFNGVGGGAAALVSLSKYVRIASSHPALYVTIEILLGVIIGCVSFAGSVLSFAKLQELMTGKPVTYPAQQVVNAIIALSILGLAITILVTPDTLLLVILACVALLFGVAFVLPIGGADVPVLISLLNSFTGLAVAASGFALHSILLVIAGTLVGASGTLLTRLMSKAMGRSLINILFGAFGSSTMSAQSATDATGRSVKSGTPEDIAILLAYSRKVVIVPGYGLAVAQAHHAAKELADTLREKGVEVFYAIHPVAGRMPGHMNVLLAEANVPYDQLKEMDEANPQMSTVDVALVVGANDVVNPAAKNSPGSPIYGMPIIDVDQASHIIFLKRSMRPGFAGIDNELLYNPKTTMLFGDAKDTLSKLVTTLATV